VSIEGIVERSREDADWRVDAICAQIGPAPFFPPDSRGSDKAKRFCNTSCTVREECLDLAIVNNERYGIWGGMTTKERDKEAKRRKRESDTPVAAAGRRNLKIERRDRMIISMSAVGDDATFVGVDPRTVQRVIANNETGSVKR
jgi:WhiB family redox-sensing transcriptional regulator